MNQRQKRNRSILFWGLGILGVFLLAASIFVIRSLSIFNDTLEEITTDKTPTAAFTVYVLKEDPAVSLSDTAKYSYGTTENLRKESFSSLWEQLQSAMGQLPILTDYENIFDLVDALNHQSVRAIVLDEAYKESLAEVSGYEWTDEGLKAIFQFFVEQPKEPEENQAQSPSKVPETFLLYLSGIDTYGSISTRSRSDVNILMAVNTKTQKISMVATPRDFYLSFSQTNGQKDKLTHAGIYGVEASIDALERLYDVDVSYYLRLNFSGFVEIIDALGGVEVYSEYAFSVPNIKNYQKGYNWLTGLEALAFARERYSFPDGDYQRVKNQMEVIKGVIRACASPAILKNYKEVMDAVGDSMQTNMPEKVITGLIKMQLTEKIDWSVSTYTTRGTGAYRPTYSMPGQNLYVILPDPASVEEAKALLSEVAWKEETKSE